MSDFDPLFQRNRNNLDFIRFAAAVLVIFSHAYPLGSGNSDYEPFILFTRNQLSGGSLAVIIFFVLSGFLITASAQRRHDWLFFIKARILRIYPGYIVTVLLAILVLGPLFTTLPLAQYWNGAVTPALPSSLLHLSTVNSLPGVFENNIYPRAVNGSLWTLGHEMTAYLFVLLLGLLGMLKRRPVTVVFFFLVVIRLVEYEIYPRLQSPPLGQVVIHQFFSSDEFSLGSWLLMSFTAGMFFYLHRKDIRLTGRGCTVALTTGALCLLLQFGLTIWLCTGGAYLLFYLATREHRRLSHFGDHGDFSYGIYIYAFPVQQILVHFFGGAMPPMLNFALALPFTLLLAYCSWHWVEQPALKLKSTSIRQDVLHRFRRKPVQA